MLSNFLKNNITSQASMVEYGYGQVEPNHLSAQRTGQIYAQLPAAATINVLEQGQFVKYNYAKGVCDFGGGATASGEWMLVYNETKLYRENQLDCEFAMKKDDYNARVYSPFGYALDKNGDPVADEIADRQARYLNGNGVDSKGITFDNVNHTMSFEGVDKTFPVDDFTAGPDYYEIAYNEDPMHFFGPYKEAMMPENTKMVPRVFKTNVGDIYTTNTVNATFASLSVGDTLKVGANGILEPGTDDNMTWQVVKKYTMPDHQVGVKIMRIV